MKHVTCRQYRLSLFIDVHICTKNIAISAYNLLRLWIPHNELLITIFHCIEFIQVKSFTCTTTSSTEYDFAKSSDFSQHIWSILLCHNVFVIRSSLSDVSSLSSNSLLTGAIISSILILFLSSVIIHIFCFGQIVPMLQGFCSYRTSAKVLVCR